jgi:uncharacterized protein
MMNETPQENIRGLFDHFTSDQFEALTSEISDRIMDCLRPPLRKLELLVTEACNLSCDYCFIPHNPAPMDWAMAKKSVDFALLQNRDSPDWSITFFGGEPLLQFDLIKKIVAYAQEESSRRDKTVNFSITTNGTLLDEEKAVFAVEAGFNYLLSLDGLPAVHDKHRRFSNGKGSFSQVIDKINLLKRHQGWVGARLTLRPDTIGQLAAGVKFLFEQGVNQFLFGPDADIPWSISSIREFEKQYLEIADYYVAVVQSGWALRIRDFEDDLASLKQNSHLGLCGAGQNTIAVRPNGDIYPCSKFIGIKVPGGTHGYRLGNIHEGYTEPVFHRDLLEPRLHLRPKCLRCRLLEFCQGGCPASSLLRRGTIYETLPIKCAQVRAKLKVLRKYPDIAKFSPSYRPEPESRPAE